MQQYIGTIQALAKSMNLGEYNKFKILKTPDNKDPKTEGYLVKYLSSDSSNHSDYKNHISWSPKEEFDKAYKLFSNTSMGAIRVGVDFNPSNNPQVDIIKLKAADLINSINSLIEPGERSKRARCVNIAITDIEKGAMMAVKANFR